MSPSTLFVIDDEPQARRGVAALAKSMGFPCRAFASAEEFLSEYAPSWTGCILLDLRLPGMSGLELQERLLAMDNQLPVILVSAYADVAAAVRAMGNGALTVIEKPYRADALVDAVRRAIQADGQRREIARRKEADRTLPASAEDLRDLIANLPGVAYRFKRTADGKYSFPFVSRTSYELFGVQADDAMRDGNLLFAKVVPEDLPGLGESIEESASTRTPWTCEFRVAVPAGIRWIHGSSLPRAQDDGSILWCGILTDATDRKRTEAALRRSTEELEKANRQLAEAMRHATQMTRQAEAANLAKSRFLANMSHETRTPLTAILGFAELLMDQRLRPEEQREFLQTIQRNGRSLLDLLSNILDLSQIEGGSMEMRRLDCPLPQVIDEVLAAVKPSADEKGLPLSVDCQAPLPPTIRTDPDRLRQVLVHLLGNAIKFTERGHVQMTVRCLDAGDGQGRLEFVVSDTGIGIAPDAMGELFQPFVQADNSITRRHEGSGLGLALSRRLARLLGGDIAVESRLGEGSTFTLSIDPGPLQDLGTQQAAPASAPGQAGVQTPPEEGDLRGRVLLAEDVPDVQRLVGEILRQWGLEVDCAGNGRDACTMAKVAQLLAAFVEELSPRARLIETAFSGRQLQALAEWTHQLKGAAGLYGFSAIAESAKRVCEGARRGDPWDQLEASVGELLALCRQTASQRAGANRGAAPDTGSESPFPDSL